MQIVQTVQTNQIQILLFLLLADTEVTGVRLLMNINNKNTRNRI